MTRRFFLFLFLCFALAASPVMAANLRVSAASSLTDALHDIGRIYQQATHETILFDFGASGTLARQIAEGAPSDVFVSADEAKMDQLQQRGFIIKGSRRSILSNTLVIIVPSDSNLKITSATDLADDAISNIAVAEPQSVPAGIYAKEYLRAIHVWDRIKDKIIPTENVRAALAAVESGNVQAGIVYRATLHRFPPVAAGAGDLPQVRLHPQMTAEEWRIAAFTLEMAATATLLILPPGLLLGWLLARRNWPGKSLVETLVTLPIVMPPVATGLLLLQTFGRRRMLGSFLDRIGIDVVFTWKAVVLAMMVMSIPLLLRAARTAFEEVNPRLEQIAETLGASPVRVFFTITLPLARRGVAGGVVLAFARAVGEFGATILVAGDIPGRTRTIALTIYERVQLGHDSSAYRMVALSAIIAFAALWTSETLLRPRRRA